MSEAGATIENPPAVERPPMRPLGLWATFGWALLAFLLAQAVGTAVVFLWFPEQLPSATALRYGGILVALVTLITNPVLVALLAGIARWRTGGSAAAYLGLTGFSRSDFWVGFLAVAAVAGAIDLASWLAGVDIVSNFQTEVFASARAEGWLVPLFLAIVVVGPIGEEVMFRGFLFRGWVTQDEYGIFAIIVITELWAAMHVQYDWYGITEVFLIGMVLGWIRWRSGSTLLTIALHILVNLESTVETLVKAGSTAS
jgi:uncharacterized protein